MSGPNVSNVRSVEETVGCFQGERMAQLLGWTRRLSADPGRLEPLEREANAAFAQGADLLVAGLLAVVMQQAEFLATGQRTRPDHAFPLARGRPREIRVRF